MTNFCNMFFAGFIGMSLGLLLSQRIYALPEISFFPAEELGHKAKVIRLTLKTPDDKTHYYTCSDTQTLPQCYGIDSKDNSLIVTSENQKDELYNTSC